jgi:lipoprotein NlpD
MNKISMIFLGAVIGAVAACTTTRIPAPVVDRSTGGKAAGNGARPKPAEGHGYYTVKRGDTLYRIALEFGQNYRDLVAWNNLASPSDIRVDQVLRVLPPETGTVAGNVQAGSVAPASGVEVRPLPGSVPSPAVSVANKTGPRGDKRPYSEAALDELQKPDPGISPVVKADPSKTTAGSPVDKPVDAAGAPGPDDEGIGWIWPAEGKVIGAFDAGKKGIDIAGKLGQPVLAAGAGTVLYASSVRGYGNLVIVKHTSNLLSAYAHNKTILVKEGQTVSKGQKIAEMGNSDTDAVKLHFEIRQQGKPVDPSKFLPNR